MIWYVFRRKDRCKADVLSGSPSSEQTAFLNMSEAEKKFQYPQWILDKTGF